MFFNNCRLTNVNLIQVENKHYEAVARCLYSGKIQTVLEIIVLLHSHSQRFFANVSLKFSNSNNRRMTFARVRILLYVMQLFEEYLSAIKKILFLILRVSAAKYIKK